MAASQDTHDQVAALRKRLLEQKGQVPVGATPAPAPAQATNGAGRASSDDDIEGLEIDPSEVQTAWDPVRSPVEIVNICDYVKGESKSYKLTYRCVAGPNEGRCRDDWAPKQGGGLAKTYRIAEALGLRDKETGKVKFGSKAAIVGKRMWIDVVMVPEKYEKADGTFEVRERDQILFPSGYDHIDAFTLPSVDDPFAENEPVATGR